MTMAGAISGRLVRRLSTPDSRVQLLPPANWRCSMAIRLDHIIVPSHDRVGAAKLLARLLDVPWEESRGADADFDAILTRIQSAGITYRSRPHGDDDLKINTRLGGKNLYWKDA